MGDWKTIITIGREYGAGGRTVAKLLSDRLGIPHYDKEIITLAAEKSGRRTREADRLLMDGLFTTLTNVNFDNAAIRRFTERVRAQRETLGGWDGELVSLWKASTGRQRSRMFLMMSLTVALVTGSLRDFSSICWLA